MWPGVDQCRVTEAVPQMGLGKVDVDREWGGGLPPIHAPVGGGGTQHAVRHVHSVNEDIVSTFPEEATS